MNEAELKAHWKERRGKKSAPPDPSPANHPAPAARVDVLDAAAADPDFSAREAQCIALRLLGHSNAEIAESLGISKQVVANYLYNARQKGRLLGDLDNLLTHKAAGLAVDNLIDGLQTGDKEYTLETLKGLGYLRNHSQIKTEGGAGQVALQVVVELPPGVSDPAAIPMKGQIVGVPRAELTAGEEEE